MGCSTGSLVWQCSLYVIFYVLNSLCVSTIGQSSGLVKDGHYVLKSLNTSQDRLLFLNVEENVPEF